MATTRRPFPFTWCTWLTGLLAGDDNCVYAAWFKSHHKYDKRPDDRGFSLDQWKADHTAMMNQEVARLEADGWACSIEDQNAFKIKGATAILSGKMDIVATRGDEVRIEDCKSGKPKASDVQQVLIYMIAAKRQWPQFQSRRVVGAVVYREGETLKPPAIIEPEAANRPVQTRLFNLMKVMGSTVPPRKVPSARECKFCDIGKADCPDRIDEEEKPDILTSEW